MIQQLSKFLSGSFLRISPESGSPPSKWQNLKKCNTLEKRGSVFTMLGILFAFLVFDNSNTSGP